MIKTTRCEAYGCPEWVEAKITLVSGEKVYYCTKHLKGLLKFGESPQQVVYICIFNTCLGETEPPGEIWKP